MSLLVYNSHTDLCARYKEFDITKLITDSTPPKFEGDVSFILDTGVRMKGLNKIHSDGHRSTKVIDLSSGNDIVFSQYDAEGYIIVTKSVHSDTVDVLLKRYSVYGVLVEV